MRDPYVAKAKRELTSMSQPRQERGDVGLETPDTIISRNIRHLYSDIESSDIEGYGTFESFL